MRCGTSLLWRSEDKTDTLDIFLGTLDETPLRVFGKELATPNQFQFYCENQIAGVTDLLKTGRRFAKEDDSEELESVTADFKMNLGDDGSEVL